jgi:hypothetical protein
MMASPQKGTTVSVENTPDDSKTVLCYHSSIELNIITYISPEVVMLLFSCAGNVYGIFVRGLVLFSYRTHGHILRARISHSFTISFDEFLMLECRFWPDQWDEDPGDSKRIMSQ